MDKAVVVYYTWSWGNTERIAASVAAELDADLIRIDTIEPYPRVEDLVVAKAKDEVFGKKTPPIKPLNVDLSGYGTIVLGCPVWWLSMAPAMRTFLVEHGEDLKGKRVGCFVTRAKWRGTEIADMEGLLPECEHLPSFECEFGSDVAYELITSEQDVMDWVHSLKDLI